MHFILKVSQVHCLTENKMRDISNWPKTFPQSVNVICKVELIYLEITPRADLQTSLLSQAAVSLSDEGLTKNRPTR